MAGRKADPVKKRTYHLGLGVLHHGAYNTQQACQERTAFVGCAYILTGRQHGEAVIDVGAELGPRLMLGEHWQLSASVGFSTLELFGWLAYAIAKMQPGGGPKDGERSSGSSKRSYEFPEFPLRLFVGTAVTWRTTYQRVTFLVTLDAEYTLLGVPGHALKYKLPSGFGGGISLGIGL